MFGLEIAIKAIILGVIEGLTEFIPVSSTAHLLFASQIIDFTSVGNGVFEISIQLGAIIAVCFIYRKKLFDVLFTIHNKKSSQNFTLNVFLAFLPAAIFGALLYPLVKSIFLFPEIIASTLIAGGIAIILVEKHNIKPELHEIDKLSKKQSIMIGLFQVLAIIPGVSRSGATILGSLLLKLDRKTAAEFSFFLAIPTIFGAVVYDLYSNYQILTLNNLGTIFIGFVAAFLSSLIVIKWLINFVSHNSFIPFAYYRIVIGLLVWVAIFFQKI